MHLLLFVVALLVAPTAQAADKVGQCVFPKTVKQPGGLRFKRPVYIFESPDDRSPKKLLRSFVSFTVGAEAAGGFIQLVATPGQDSPPSQRAGTIVGWAKLSDFDLQELRNCN